MLVLTYKSRWVVQQVCVPRYCIFFEYAKLVLCDSSKHPIFSPATQLYYCYPDLLLVWLSVKDPGTEAFCCILKLWKHIRITAETRRLNRDNSSTTVTTAP